MTGHIDRTDLIRAAQSMTTTESVKKHIAQCPDCGEFYALFEVFPVAGNLPLTDAPSGWIAKAADIMTSSSITGKIKRLAASLSFDSWAQPALAGVRSVDALGERRIRYESQEIVFDLRVEQERKGYLMTARITKQQEPCDGFVVSHSAGVAVATHDGFFEWTAVRPPKNITLKSDDLEIVLPEIAWNRPKAQ